MARHVRWWDAETPPPYTLADPPPGANARRHAAHAARHAALEQIVRTEYAYALPYGSRNALAARLGVSPPTISRDLVALFGPHSCPIAASALAPSTPAPLSRLHVSPALWGEAGRCTLKPRLSVKCISICVYV